jgi:hypothetical protein
MDLGLNMICERCHCVQESIAADITWAKLCEELEKETRSDMAELNNTKAELSTAHARLATTNIHVAILIMK